VQPHQRRSRTSVAAHAQMSSSLAVSAAILAAVEAEQYF